MQKTIMLIMILCFIGSKPVQCASAVVSPRRALALHNAIDKNNVKLVETLLREGAEPAQRNSFGDTAFHCAIGNTAILRILCATRPDAINARNMHGDTALHAAIVRTRTKAVGILLDAGANPALFDSEGRTGLHCILYYAQADKLMLNHVCRLRPDLVNAPSSEVHLPLHEAINRDQLEAVSILIDTGANPALHDFTGRTAFHCALGKMQILNFLCERCPEQINTIDDLGRTPLDVASEFFLFDGDPGRVISLLEGYGGKFRFK
jgi:ankyrin repeat protein